MSPLRQQFVLTRVYLSTQQICARLIYFVGSTLIAIIPGLNGAIKLVPLVGAIMIIQIISSAGFACYCFCVVLI